MPVRRQRKASATASESPAVASANAIAAVDVGTTSIRLGIGQIGADGRWQMLEELVHPAAVGADTFRCGLITPATLRALCKIFENFNRLLRDYDVKVCRAVATSALREATNREVVADRVQHASGIALEILDAVEESRLMYQILQPFLRRHVAKAGQHTLIMDLGGGSTELMILQGENLVFGSARRLGAARLFHSLRLADAGDNRAFLASMTDQIVASTLSLYRAYPIKECIIINSLLMRALKGEPGVENLEGGLVLPARAAKAAAAAAGGMSAADMPARFQIDPSEADFLAIAFLILARFLEHISVDRLFFAEADFLSALLHDLALRCCGAEPEATFARQVLGSAIGVGEKYRYDRQHAEQVAKMAGEIFDAVAGFLGLARLYRLHLQVAAILHDIGMFVSELAHHKHSAYLVQWSDIVGLSESERTLVAQVCRYHRKTAPRPQHAEFMALPMEERLIVTKLASILRIADALDRGHHQAARSLRPTLTEENLTLEIDAAGEMTVEEAALKDKARLFEDITGLKVVLRRQA